jgi:hypothetical protein
VELRRIPIALAQARERIWAAAGVKPTAGVDRGLDATLVTARSDKHDAAPTYKEGFGFNPLGLWPIGLEEPLAAMLHVAARLAHHAGRLHLRIDTTWPWATTTQVLCPASPRPARPLSGRPALRPARPTPGATTRPSPRPPGPSRPGTGATRPPRP